MFMRSAGKRMILYGMLPFDTVKVLAIYIYTHIYIYMFIEVNERGASSNVEVENVQFINKGCFFLIFMFILFFLLRQLMWKPCERDE